MWQYRSICYIELYTVTEGNLLVCGSIGVYVILSCTQLQKVIFLCVAV